MLVQVPQSFGFDTGPYDQGDAGSTPSDGGLSLSSTANELNQASLNSPANNGNIQQIGSLYAMPAPYPTMNNVDAPGVGIRLGYKSDGIYSAFNWIQSVSMTWHNNHKWEFDGSSSAKPFYYTTKEEAEKVIGEGYSTQYSAIFEDQPGKYGVNQFSTWVAQTTLMGRKNNQWFPIQTVTWGLRRHGLSQTSEDVIVIPLKITTNLLTTQQDLINDARYKPLIIR